MKFKYECLPSGVWFPILNITLINPKAKKHVSNFKVLVDSGAAVSVFPASLGEAVGLDITSGNKVSLRGATGVVEEQFLHNVMIVIGGHDIELEVGFSYSFKFPFGLLGQRGFFEQSRICFDLPKKDFEIIPKKKIVR
ncbi:MAG: aspartyl protease family protein [bacterium]|nr:aspartyl protease family protein [bacterium]